jgi:2',3'-cyclic-nucleotide 2'-phosphodiesterase (5'-nucleotidase family)
VRPAAVCGAVALSPHPGIVMHYGVENGGEQPSLDAGIPPEPVEDELRDGGVANQLGAAQHLEVARHRGLGEVEDGLEIGDEERRRGQTIEDPQPGGLGDGEEQIRGGRGIRHISMNIYTARRMGKVGPWGYGDPRPFFYISPPMLSLLIAVSLAVAQVPDSAHIVLVATADVHGRTTGWDYVAHRPAAGGLARVAPVIDSLRQRYPGQLVVLDAGDLLQGDPYATYFGRAEPRVPHPIIEAMNLIGYDAATPGNHDFDFGVPAFFRAIGDAAFPFVSANIYAERADTLTFPPFRVLQRGGVRVAITGFTTPGVMLWDRSLLKGSLRVVPIDRRAAATIQTMRKTADVAVVLSHSGMDAAASYDTTGIGAEDVATSFASLPTRPDVVIVGHSHREITDSLIKGVHFVQPRAYAEGVSIVHLDLRRVKGRWQVTRIRADALRVTDRSPSPLVSQRLEPTHVAAQAWVDQAVGYSPVSLRARDARAQPSPLQDFVLEVQRSRAHADLASGPVFDLRAGFEADTIRRGQVLALYPYDNTLRAVRVSGRQLREYLEWSARYFRVDPAGRVAINDSIPGYDYDIVRGARYDVDLLQPVGQRIRNLSVRGRPVQPADSFILALNSHRQTGAGGYAMLRGAPVVYDRNENIAELVVEEIRKRGGIDPEAITPSQWRIVPAVAAAAVRQIYGIAPEPLPASPRDTVLLRIFATADIHGDLRRRAAPLARAMDSLGAECHCPTVRLDAGDAMQGDLAASASEGRAVLEVLDRMGYAAGALGDHDFDWPLDTLRLRLSESKHPFVVANVFDSAGGRRPPWLTPYRMLETGRMRVAVIGYITAATKVVQPEERTRGLRFGEGELALHDVLGEVRAARPDLTVLLAHAGASCDSLVCDGELTALAGGLGGSGVDLVLGGHGHRRVDTRVAGMPVVAPEGGASLAVVDLLRTSAGGKAFRVRLQPVGDGESAPAGTPLAAAIDRLSRWTDSLERHVFAQIKRPLTRQGAQHALGALIAEARRNAVRTDVAIVRNDAIRADLPAGPATYARLLEVEPAGAGLVRVTLTGSQLTSVLEQGVAGASGPMVHVAGASVRYDPQAKAGRRIKSVELLGGRKVRPQDQYTLATDDSTAAGAGGLEGLRDLPAQRAGLLDVEALAGYLRRLPQPVEAEAARSLVSTRR